VWCKDTTALSRPRPIPMAAEPKNMRQNLPNAVRNASAPLTSAISGLANSSTVLSKKYKNIELHNVCGTQMLSLKD